MYLGLAAPVARAYTFRPFISSGVLSMRSYTMLAVEVYTWQHSNTDRQQGCHRLFVGLILIIVANGFYFFSQAVKGLGKKTTVFLRQVRWVKNFSIPEAMNSRLMDNLQ